MAVAGGRRVSGGQEFLMGLSGARFGSRRQLGDKLGNKYQISVRHWR